MAGFGIGWRPGEPRPLPGVKCPACGGGMELVRSCQSVTLRCSACGAKYPLTDFIDQMDVIEEVLGIVPLDRI